MIPEVMTVIVEATVITIEGVAIEAVVDDTTIGIWGVAASPTAAVDEVVDEAAFSNAVDEEEAIIEEEVEVVEEIEGEAGTITMTRITDL